MPSFWGPRDGGRRPVRAGCIRHYNQDIKERFESTPAGTPVLIIYEPVNIGFLRGRMFIEVHEDIYQKIPDMMEHVAKVIGARQLGGQVNIKSPFPPGHLRRSYGGGA